MLPSTDKDDAVTSELISKSPSVEIVKPPPAVIPPEPIVRSPVSEEDEVAGLDQSQHSETAYNL